MKTSEPEEDDWRLGHSKTYDGSTWHRRSYFSWSPTWDHDHCSFCWTSFEVPGSKAAQDPDVRTVGWTSDDEYRWVCDTCFADFKERFRWRERTSLPSDHAQTSPEEADRTADEVRRRHEYDLVAEANFERLSRRTLDDMDTLWQSLFDAKRTGTLPVGDERKRLWESCDHAVSPSSRLPSPSTRVLRRAVHSWG